MQTRSAARKRPRPPPESDARDGPAAAKKPRTLHGSPQARMWQRCPSVVARLCRALKHEGYSNDDLGEWRAGKKAAMGAFMEIVADLVTVPDVQALCRAGLAFSMRTVDAWFDARGRQLLAETAVRAQLDAGRQAAWLGRQLRRPDRPVDKSTARRQTLVRVLEVVIAQRMSARGGAATRQQDPNLLALISEAGALGLVDPERAADVVFAMDTDANACALLDGRAPQLFVRTDLRWAVICRCLLGMGVRSSGVLRVCLSYVPCDHADVDWCWCEPTRSSLAYFSKRQERLLRASQQRV